MIPFFFILQKSSVPYPKKYMIKKKTQMKAERQTLVKIFNTSWQPSYLFLVSAACLAPTEKNSVITSSGIPLVSGTFTKTNTHDMRHTTAYKPKTPARPMDLSITGSV